MSRLLLLTSGSCLVVGVTAVVFLAVGLRPVERPRFGRRGRNRSFALRTRVWFRTADAVGRYLAAALLPLVPDAVTAWVERKLAAAGYPLGLTAGELLAWSAAAAAISVASSISLMARHDLWAPGVIIAGFVAACLPFVRVSVLSKLRVRRITLRLPSVLELIVMCMSAGLDLPRSLHCVVDSATDRFDPIVEELDTVVRELELGRTRREALRSFAERVSSTEVEELVNTVIQSEEKGVSLAETLAIQSRTSRLRRSMHAEQAASGAALMLVGPMSLIFLCVIALLLGPVIIRTMDGGFGA